MVSFDVLSLFTNISLKESIELAFSYITEGNPNLMEYSARLVQTIGFLGGATFKLPRY